MRSFVFFILLASPALAHPGHLGDVLVDPWLAGAAAGAAGIAILWEWLKGKKDDEAVEEEAEPA